MNQLHSLPQPEKHLRLASEVYTRRRLAAGALGIVATISGVFGVAKVLENLPPNPTSCSGETAHLVLPGDTVWGIAGGVGGVREGNIDIRAVVSEILTENDIKQGSTLQPGEELMVPEQCG